MAVICKLGAILMTSHGRQVNHIEHLIDKKMLNTFAIPIDKYKCIVYAPLKGIAFYASTNAINIINKLAEGEPLTVTEINSAVYKKIIDLDLHTIENMINEKVAVKKQEIFDPSKLVIIPTEGCNLGCTYCYASAVPVKDRIEWNLIEKGIQMIIENASMKNDKKASVTFYGGGEPTIHWDLLVNTVEYGQILAKNKSVKFNCKIITNGTLLDEDKVIWLKNNSIGLNLSFDILPDVQLFQRPYANGNNSHSKVMKTIALLTKHGCKFNVRATVTENNLLSMVETVEFIHEHLNQITKIHLEPSTGIGRSINTSTREPLDKVFVSEFLKAYNRGKELGIIVRCSMSDSLGNLKGRFCNPEFTITSSGKLTACHRYSRDETTNSEIFMYGNYDKTTNEFVVDLDKLNSLSDANVHNFSGCNNCFAKYNCAGDCLSTRVKDGEIPQYGNRCYMVRELLKESLIEKLT